MLHSRPEGHHVTTATQVGAMAAEIKGAVYIYIYITPSWGCITALSWVE
jgi:hypothetical protein